jgi:imidazoleglycerol-phosphate dehydratase
MKRQAEITRKTKETHITLTVDLDGSGRGELKTGIGFFDHLLDALCKHAGFDLSIDASGDLYVDGHHTVEDVGIVLGQAFDRALGERKGITRFGFAYCPLDEALARSVVDISGRPFFNMENPMKLRNIGEFQGELFPEFLRAFAMNAKITLHIALLCGQNQHHALEAMIKSLARALRMAVAPDNTFSDIPSTKGVL